MSRKKRTDAPDYQHYIREKLIAGIQSPIELDDKEKEIFDRVIAELPVDDWEEHRVEMAANLARLIAQAEGLQSKIMEEGVTIFHHSRGEIINPKFAAQQQLYSTITRLMRVLGVSASQRGVSADMIAKRKEAQKEAKAAISGAKKGLLA